MRSGVVLCHGHFDFLHIGHLLHLQEASCLGERLIVSITADEFVTKPGRPIFNESERERMLSELRCVDEVYICRADTGIPAIHKFNPEYYVKGIDYSDSGIIESEMKACEKVGAEIVFTSAQKYSTTDLIERLK